MRGYGGERDWEGGLGGPPSFIILAAAPDFVHQSNRTGD